MIGLFLINLINAGNIYKDKKDFQQFFKENLQVYTTTKECNKINFNNDFWKNKKIVLMTYDYPTLNKLGYCGILYHK